MDKPYPHPEDRLVFDFIRTHWQPGDRVYSYGGWAIAQRYYASLYGIPADAQVGPDFLGSTLQADANRGLRDVPDLRSDRRVWVVSLDSDRKRVVQILDGLGTRLGKYNALDTGVVLYGFGDCTGDCLVPVNDGDPD
jgi:hypothetical protein